MRLMPKGRVKYVLAAIGAVYVVLFAAYLVYAGMNRKEATGPSELELHPEKQAEIRARERVEQLRTQLNLSDEQTQQVVEIFQKHGGMNRPPMGGPREGLRGLQDELGKVLTPEQQALLGQMRPGGPGGPGGRGGPGGPGGRGPRGPGGPGGPPDFMNSERMDAIKEAMTPEQRERFEKQLERMRQRMPFPRGPGGGGPGGRGPGGGEPPGGPPR